MSIATSSSQLNSTSVADNTVIGSTVDTTLTNSMNTNSVAENEINNLIMQYFYGNETAFSDTYMYEWFVNMTFVEAIATHNDSTVRNIDDDGWMTRLKNMKVLQTVPAPLRLSPTLFGFFTFSAKRLISIDDRYNDICTNTTQQQQVIDYLVSTYLHANVVLADTNTDYSTSTNRSTSTRTITNADDTLYVDSDNLNDGDGIMLSSEQLKHGCQSSMLKVFNTINYINEQVTSGIVQKNNLYNATDKLAPIRFLVVPSDYVFPVSNDTITPSLSEFTPESVQYSNYTSLSVVFLSNDAIQFIQNRSSTSTTSLSSNRTSSHKGGYTNSTLKDCCSIQPVVFSYDYNGDGLVNVQDFQAVASDLATSTGTDDMGFTEVQEPTPIFFLFRFVAIFVLLIACYIHQRRRYYEQQQNRQRHELIAGQLRQTIYSAAAGRAGAGTTTGTTSTKSNNNNALTEQEFDDLLIHTKYTNSTGTTNTSTSSSQNNDTTKATSTMTASIAGSSTSSSPIPQQSSAPETEEQQNQVSVQESKNDIQNSTPTPTTEDLCDDDIATVSLEEGRMQQPVSEIDSTISNGNNNDNGSRFDQKTYTMWSLSNYQRKLQQDGEGEQDDDEANAGCCSICLDEIQDGDVITTLPMCKHWFHKKCIREWLLDIKSDSCPLCKTQIKENNAF